MNSHWCKKIIILTKINNFGKPWICYNIAVNVLTVLNYFICERWKRGLIDIYWKLLVRCSYTEHYYDWPMVLLYLLEFSLKKTNVKIIFLTLNLRTHKQLKWLRCQNYNEQNLCRCYGIVVLTSVIALTNFNYPKAINDLFAALVSN